MAHGAPQARKFSPRFCRFDYRKVAEFDARDIKRLVADAGIVRNKAKIAAAVNNAQRFLEVRKEFGTFAKYMWSWVSGKTIHNQIKSIADCRPYTDEAVAWSKDLKQRGFQFLGPTVVYAHMQAVGMVNDHTVDCFRYQELVAQTEKETRTEW